MGKICDMCGTMTMFYVWTTTRYFNINKYLTLKGIVGEKVPSEYKNSGRHVCLSCVHKHDLMDKGRYLDDKPLPSWYKKPSN